MWLRLQISPRICLMGVVSVLDGNLYWRCSNVHRDLLGGSCPVDGIVKSRCLGAIQPEILRVKPRIKVYSTWEMIHVLYCSPRGGPNLASFVWAILEYGKVKNNVAFSFAFTFEQAPVLVARLERDDFENCRLLDLKSALRHFVGFVCREYWIILHRFRNPALLPSRLSSSPVSDNVETPVVDGTAVTGSGTEEADTPSPFSSSVREDEIRAISITGSGGGRPVAPLPERMEEDVTGSDCSPAGVATLGTPAVPPDIPVEVTIPATLRHGEGNSVPDYDGDASSGIKKGPEGTLSHDHTALDGLKDKIPWEDLSPEITMEILYSIVHPESDSSPNLGQSSFSPPSAVSVSTPTTNNNNNNNNNNTSDYSTQKKIKCSSFLRLELEDEISSFFPNLILMKTKKGERIYLPKKQ